MEQKSIPDHTLDTTGLLCPEPVMLLHKAIRDSKSGELILVIATDPSTERDIPAFCEFLGHHLVQQDSIEGRYRYYVRKGGA